MSEGIDNEGRHLSDIQRDVLYPGVQGTNDNLTELHETMAALVFPDRLWSCSR
jgi:hypothetical protein